MQGLVFDDNDGYTLVKLARSAVEHYLNYKKVIEPDSSIRSRYSMKYGVFVTINEYNKGMEELRGCIGFPMPTKELYSALIDAAIASAFNDPRFKPLSIDEYPKITFEVSILTEPELIKVNDPREYKDIIKVGRDGLIIVWRYGSGLLLPQVPVEYGWDAERFLCETCMKANALPDCWLYEDTKVYRFEAIIFKEVEPNGKVVRVRLV
jgi:uncharacterized protein (TIGR00296 family)